MPTSHGVGSDVTTQVSQIGTRDHTTPWPHGGGSLLVEGPSPTAAIKAPMEPLQLEIMAEPAVSTMCTSHIIQDETMEVTYMDMVTTSWVG